MGPPMRGHDDVVTSVAFSADGARIVSRPLDNINAMSVSISPRGTYAERRFNLVSAPMVK
jgi:hypothetical protein